MDDDQALTTELRAAGWRQGRRVARSLMEDWLEAIKEDGFSVFQAGVDVLGEYGGLKLGRSGPGVRRARLVVELDPLLVLGEADRYHEFERLLGCRLFPLGELDHGHALLALSDDQALYFLMDEVWLAGSTFREGLAAVLLGLDTKLLEGLTPWRP